MKPLERRLQKLEASVSAKTDPSAIIADLTCDEMNVWLLVLSHLAVQRDSSNLSANEIEEMKATIDKIEAKIRHWALNRLKLEYQRYMDRIASGEEYVPALLDSEHDGFDKSNIMDRRRAVRAEPLIAALLKETEHEASDMSRPDLAG